MAFNLKKNTVEEGEKEEERGENEGNFFSFLFISYHDAMVIKFGNYDATEANSFRHPR